MITFTALNKVTSDPAYIDKIILTDIPREQRPCKMGLAYPARTAIFGSMCKGFGSPKNSNQNIVQVLLQLNYQKVCKAQLDPHWIHKNK